MGYHGMGAMMGAGMGYGIPHLHAAASPVLPWKSSFFSFTAAVSTPWDSLMQVYRPKWKPGGAYAGNASGTADPPPPEQLLVEQLLQFEYEVPPPPTHPHTHSRTHSPCV